MRPEDALLKQLRENLLYLRIRRTPMLSQRLLSKRMGVDRGSYARYEKGQRDIPLYLLIRLCLYYGVTLDELFYRDMKTEGVNHRNEDLAQGGPAANPGGKAHPVG